MSRRLGEQWSAHFCLVFAQLHVPDKPKRLDAIEKDVEEAVGLIGDVRAMIPREFAPEDGSVVFGSGSGLAQHWAKNGKTAAGREWDDGPAIGSLYFLDVPWSPIQNIGSEEA